LTDCDTKSRLFARAGEQGAGSAVTKRYLQKRQSLSLRSRRIAAAESTVRRFASTTTIKARGRLAQMKALCVF